MNQTNIVEMMQRRDTQLTMLSVTLVGITMVFMIPSLIEEALARIDGTIKLTGNCCFTSAVHGVMDHGKFSSGPTLVDPKTIKFAITSGTLPPIDFEKGFVQFGINTVTREDPILQAQYHNPSFGKNKGGLIGGFVQWECHITQKVRATANWVITYVPRTDIDNNQCDLVPKKGGLDQSKIIREKLHC